MNEITLKAKYRNAGMSKRGSNTGHDNSGVSMGKHVPHPNVHGFRVHGYKCDARWNPPER